LTDNLLEVQTRQLTHACIVDLFERRFSADGVKHHKPSRQAYAHLEKEFGAKPSDFCLIACHTASIMAERAIAWWPAFVRYLTAFSARPASVQWCASNAG
jgi:2-haloacid dehalogenase